MNQLSDKVILLAEIDELLLKHRHEILGGKQIVPWASSKLGPCYAVTQDAVVGGFERLKGDIINILRKYEVDSTYLY